MRDGIVSALIGFALLTTPGWTGESSAQTKIARVGILMIDVNPTDERAKIWLDPFRRMLASEGWIEGQNISFEYGRAGVDRAGFAEAATVLVQHKMDVIVAISAPSTR